MRKCRNLTVFNPVPRGGTGGGGGSGGAGGRGSKLRGSAFAPYLTGLRLPAPYNKLIIS